MDLLQESSSIWDEFLRRPCPQVDLLSLWPLAPFFSWQPWHLLNSGTLVTFCLLGILGISKLRTEWFLENDNCTVLYQLYCTILYCTVPYFYFSCWYTPLNQAIYAWSFRQKFYGWWWWWHCNYSFKLQGSRGDLESLSWVELDSRPRKS